MSATPQKRSSPAPGRRPLARFAAPAVVALALLFVAAVRVRTLHVPLERDEGEYAYAGQLMLQGIPPYRLAYNMKFPGTYAAYAALMAVFGQSPAGIHAGAILVTTLTALLLYALGRKVAGEAGGAVAGAVAAFLAASPSLCGLAAHATHFAALFASAGLYLLWSARRGGARPAFGAGLMFGIALLMKQQAAVFPVWGTIALLAASARAAGAPPARRLEAPAVFAAGTALPFVLTCLVLWRAGVFGAFRQWTIAYASAYVSEIPLSAAPHMLRVGLGYLVESGAPLWLLGTAGLVAVWADPRFRGDRAHLTGFAAASFLTTCPGYYFRVHYFLLMVPAFALLAGCAAAAAWRSPRLRAGATAAIVLAFAATVWGNRGPWLLQSPVAVCRALYGMNPFPEAEVVADYIRERSSPDDPIAVLGSEPEIYFLARRRSATGHIYTYALMEPQPYAHAMQEQMIREIESAAPGWVVFVRIRASWLPRSGSDPSVVDWWNHAYQRNYELAGVVEILTPERTRYAWDGPASAAASADGNALLVFRRKADRPR